MFRIYIYVCFWSLYVCVIIFTWVVRWPVFPRGCSGSSNRGSQRRGLSEVCPRVSVSSSRSCRSSICRSSWGCRRICRVPGLPRSARLCSQSAWSCSTSRSMEWRRSPQAKDCSSKRTPRLTSPNLLSLSVQVPQAARPSGEGSRHPVNHKSKIERHIHVSNSH